MRWLKRVWLETWRRIKALVGRRKMEIEKTINQWFEEAQYKLENIIISNEDIDNFCCGTTTVVKTYLDAVLLQLDNGLFLPSMADLRIVSDLINKFLWCMNHPDKKQIKGRLRRWEKSAAKEQKKLLENLIPSSCEPFLSVSKNAISQLKKILDRFSKDQVKEMPKTGQLFQQNKNLFQTDIYAQAYQQFNSAVHIDTDVLLRKIATYQKSTGKFVGDIPVSQDDIMNLKMHCLSFAWMQLKMLYRHYSWDFSAHDRAYEKLKKAIAAC